jgi:gluconate 5-dehydrogenase
MPSPLFSLENRTALVTGSSRGLGYAVARGLAEAGAAIVLNGVSEERLEAAANRLADDGFTVHRSRFDVSDEKTVVTAFEALDAAGIAVDILVNNAGIQLRRPLVDVAGPDWQRVIDVNLTGPFLVAREAARRMLRRGHGKIINIGSVLGEMARATVGPYVATKGGLRMLTRAMAAEWAEGGIQANAIGPGYLATEMTQPLVDDQQFDTWLKRRTPAGRWGLPEDIVGAAVFLASSASNYVNGQVIYVDGGMTAVV